MRWITLTLFYFLIFLNLVARKRLVAPIPWGGEEEAQEEASCSESQLLLHGCKMSRYAFCTHTHTQVTWGLSFGLSTIVIVLQDATRSRRCSAMLRQSCCVWAALQSCVSPPEAKHVSQRVSIHLCAVFIYSRGVLRWHSVACWYKHRLYHAFF